MTLAERYSVANAQEFGWGSVTGDLQPERIGHLSKYLRGNMVLDAGCGGGGFVDFISRQGLEVTGVDAYEEMIVNARKTGRRDHYVQGDLTALPFAAHTFDSTGLRAADARRDDVRRAGDFRRTFRVSRRPLARRGCWCRRLILARLRAPSGSCSPIRRRIKRGGALSLARAKMFTRPRTAQLTLRSYEAAIS